MTLQTLALVLAVGILGPLLATPRTVRIPVVVGELLAGVALGETGTRTLHPHDATFTFLANLGFALVMFVAGSHVPMRDPRLRAGLRVGLFRALGIAVLAVAAGIAVSRAFGTGHTALYAVLMASSSAALALPILDSAKLSGPAVLQLLPQVAVADAACIIALPLAIDPKHAPRAALGALAVIAAGLVVLLALRYVETKGYRQRVHDLSEERKFALELRVSLVILCALAALATRTHVSIMLAGFSLGLAVAAVGEPRRLARQLFAITEGFLGPVFFVWVGATLDLRQLAHHPKFIAAGIALAAGALLAHAVAALTGQPLRLSALATAQLGVPVAAVTVGSQLHLLKPGESSALILGALLTIAVASIAALRLQRDAQASTRASRPSP